MVQFIIGSLGATNLTLKVLRLDFVLVVRGKDKLILAARLPANDKLDHFTPERWIAAS